MGVRIYDLCLEVTRRCNMECGHCLRGEAEDVDMSKEIVDQVLEQIDRISTVTFTGGEPTLNMDLIRYFFKRAEELDKMPYSFYIVTNGKAFQHELAIELLKWYPKMEESDFCGVAVSLDDWHDELETPPILKALIFYTAEKERDSRFVPRREGRAASLNWSQPVSHSCDIKMEDDEIQLLYVSANGNMIGDCDLSYEHIDAASGYTVWDFKQMLKEHREVMGK